MKKSVIILLTIVLALYAAGATALTAELSPEDLKTGISTQLPEELKETFSSVRAGNSFPTPLDVVVIKDGVFTITSSGITANIQMPFGWVGFTQDIKAQMNDYLNTFKEPRKIVEYLISDGISLIGFDTSSDSVMLVFFEINPASGLFVDLEDQAMFEMAVEMFKSNAAKGNEISGEVINGRNFIRSMDITEAGESLVYFTYLKGAKAGFQMLPQGKNVTKNEIESLVSLMESTTLE